MAQEGEEDSSIEQRPRYDKVVCVDFDEDELPRLERNDPSIAGLVISPANWIKGAGRFLKDNTNLQKLDLIVGDSEEPEVSWLEEVFTGLSTNRHLESLILSRVYFREDGFLSDIECNYRILTPFFEYNCNLLEIGFEGLDFAHISHYLSTLEKCKDSRLESITLSRNKMNDKQMATIIRSLASKSFLQKISIQSIDGTDGERSFYELSKLLEAPSMKIKSFDLYWDENAEADEVLCHTIVKALMVNRSVKTLSLPLRHIRSWSQVLSRPMSSIETLSFKSYLWSDEYLIHLSDALAGNKTLKELILSDNKGGITLAGWRHLFRCLENDDFALQVLNISGCYITNDSITSIALSLSSNTCLKKLDISHNNISLQGWMSFFSCLLFVNPEIRRSRCSLEFIDMRGAEDQDGVIGDVERGEEVLKAILYNSLCSCNMSSVEDILSANHTLHTILRGGFGWSKEISELLELNAIEDKGEVARLKAIKYHFSSCKESGMRGKDRIFADLPDAVLPNALEWIGRGPNRDGFSLMYNVCHCFPTLVEVREANDIPSHKRMKKEGWNKSGIGD